MTALVISIDLLFSLVCWLIAWQLIRLQPQIVALMTVIDDATISVEQLGLVPALLADRQQQLQQIQQLYQQPLSVINQLWQLGWQLVRLLLWVRTRR
jgi:hypothetical protein